MGTAVIDRTKQNRTDFIIQYDLNITVSRHYTNIQHTINTGRMKIQTYKYTNLTFGVIILVIYIIHIFISNYKVLLIYSKYKVLHLFNRSINLTIMGCL
jgi:hypothetical protein